MEDSSFCGILRGAKIDSRDEIFPGSHIYRYIRSSRIRNVDGSISTKPVDALIVCDENDNKKAIIVRLYNRDLYAYTFAKDRCKGYLSKAIRTGCIKEIWPDIDTVSCSKGYDPVCYDRAKHLAELAGLRLRDSSLHFSAREYTREQSQKKGVKGRKQ